LEEHGKKKKNVIRNIAAIYQPAFIELTELLKSYIKSPKPKIPGYKEIAYLPAIITSDNGKGRGSNGRITLIREDLEEELQPKVVEKYRKNTYIGVIEIKNPQNGKKK